MRSLSKRILGGVVLVALLKEPLPLCVQSIVPLAELAPLTIPEAPWHMVWLPPADAVGAAVTVILPAGGVPTHAPVAVTV